MIRTFLPGVRRRLVAEHGIALIYVMLAMVVVFGMAGAALAAVTYDTSGTGSDTYQKQAYAAAQAGIQRYLFELNANNTYWTQCVPSGTNWLVNTSQTETPQPVPGSSTEQYAVMLLPAAGQNTYSQCSTADPVDSMIQASGANAGTMRVASTGSAVNASGKVMAQRTIVAAFKQQNFIDYAYFTNYETADPIVQVADAFASTNDQDTAIEPPDQCGAATNCGGSYQAALNGVGTSYPGATAQCTQYRYKGRETRPFFVNGSGWQGWSFNCEDIQFINNDQINGPFHSNDSVLICGSPTFGRAGNNDSVEFGGDKTVYPQGWLEAGGCAGSPRINGTLIAQDTNLGMPKVNSLAGVAATTLSGTTCLTLLSTGGTPSSPGSIQVSHPSSSQTCASGGLTTTTISYPSNGVLYVSGTACTTYDPDDPSYTGNSGCGTVYVKGVAMQPLTIGADNDIVINGNVTYGNSSAMLGLVATNFIRVYHPVAGGVCTSGGASNASGSLTNLTIDAMMLSLKHSFIVDDYGCGNNLGTLTVDGGIAQNFRGPVGQGNSGYTKNYIYDPRLEYEEPPHFLAPSNGAFAIAHQTECDVASSCDGTS